MIPCGVALMAGECDQPAQARDPLCKLHDQLAGARAQATRGDPEARASYWRARRACVDAGVYVPEAHPWDVPLPGVGEGLRRS